MKRLRICLCIVCLVFCTIGCHAQPAEVTDPQVLPTEVVSSSPEPEKKTIDLDIDGETLHLYFDMNKDEACELLDGLGVEYKNRDDVSRLRSWSGDRLMSSDFDLIFDVQGALHEVVIKHKMASNLPIMVGDLIVDVQEKLGERKWLDGSLGLPGSYYFDYTMDDYYLKAYFFNERVPCEEFTIAEIVLSKYTTEQYEAMYDPASLILTNKGGEQAEFYIGMHVDDVIAQLERLGFHYGIHNDILSGHTFDYLPEDAPPDGCSFHFYYDINNCVHTLNIYGPGAITPKGLRSDDPSERMFELYGHDYTKRESGNDYWHSYHYVCGDNYMNISASDEVDPATPIQIMEITRYVGNPLRVNSYLSYKYTH